MSVLRTFVVTGFLVLFTSDFGFADPTYRKVGDSVVLKPDHKIDSITSVTWKHRTDLALEWFGGEITYYRTFKDRCELDETTGGFTIRNLTPEDSGEYTPEINNRVLGKKELQVIKPVPKPTVSEACNKEKTVCNLICEADITSEFGPVTYEWKTDTELSTDKELSITEKNKESSFSCSLRNPVSNSASDEFPNPFNGEINTAGVAAGVAIGVAIAVVIGVLLLIGVAVLLVWWKTGHLPFLDNIFPCNNKAQSDEAEAAYGARQDAHATLPLLTNVNETNQDQAAETPNGGLHEGNKTLDDEAAGKPDDSTCAPSVDTQPEQEIISKGKEALNGHLIDNTNGDEEPNDPSCNPSVDQESNPDPSAVTSEPNSQTENNSIGKETLSGDQHANTNEDGIDKVTETADSMEQQQVPLAEQVGDDQGASGQNSRPEEPEPTDTGPETSPPESHSEEMSDTVSSES